MSSASASILSSFYVDDYLSGGDSHTEVQKKKTEAEKIVRTGGFNLRKWISNDPTILADQEPSISNPRLQELAGTSQSPP